VRFSTLGICGAAATNVLELLVALVALTPLLVELFKDTKFVDLGETTEAPDSIGAGPFQTMTALRMIITATTASRLLDLLHPPFMVFEKNYFLSCLYSTTDLNSHAI
jgi:hypothetical protein